MFTTLLTAKSEAQLSSLLLAFQTFLKSPRAVSFDGRNVTAESSCFKDVPAPDLTPGTGRHSCVLGNAVFEDEHVGLALPGAKISSAPLFYWHPHTNKL